MDNRNNKVTLQGQIVKALSFNHIHMGEKFYSFILKTDRRSGVSDMLPILVSEKIIDTSKLRVGECISIWGTFRSYNQKVGEKTRLILFVLADEIETQNDYKCELNCIELNGYLCKEPQYRKTPAGREIADILLAVNRPYGKSDYIPCICWGRNAKLAESMSIGEEIRISGRIQSREYKKVISETESETRIAYEVSISKLEVINNEN